jgi:hypothetical protein
MAEKEEKFGKEYYYDSGYILHESCEIIKLHGEFHAKKTVNEAKNKSLGKSHKYKMKLLSGIDNTPEICATESE